MEMRVVIKGHGVDKYPAKSHAQRVVDKLGIESGTIILAATPMKLYSNSDQPMPFRQDRYFYYLTGSNEPGCLVTYDIACNHLTLLLPAIDESRVVWTGRGSTVEEAMEKYDIDEAQYLPKDISAPLTHVLMHDDCCRCCLPKLWLDNQAEGLFDRSGEGRAMQARLREAFDSCRVIKDEHEIGLIRKANEITAEAHRTVLLGLHRFRNESHVDAAYTAACIAKHAKEQSYKPIAGAGSNASVLHYDRNDADFGDSQVMVLDAGCEWHCYASDVSRLSCSETTLSSKILGDSLVSSECQKSRPLAVGGGQKYLQISGMQILGFSMPPHETIVANIDTQHSQGKHTGSMHWSNASRQLLHSDRAFVTEHDDGWLTQSWNFER